MWKVSVTYMSKEKKISINKFTSVSDELTLLFSEGLKEVMDVVGTDPLKNEAKLNFDSNLCEYCGQLFYNCLCHHDEEEADE